MVIGTIVSAILSLSEAVQLALLKKEQLEKLLKGAK